MIKAQARICGVISQNAAVVKTKDDTEFLSFRVKLAVPGSRKDEPGKEILVSVTVDGTDTSRYMAGQRIEAEGRLTFRKVGENLYLNFHAELVNENPSAEDAIDGTMEFRGTVGKSVDVKTTKKGSSYVSFSAFSSEKQGDAFAFIWVRFLKFDAEKPSFLAPKAKIEVKGNLEVTAYKGEISLGCRYDEVKPWERQPFNHQSDKEKLPF